MAQGYWNRIVQVNVTAQIAPEPSVLQQTAAIVSMASTSVTAGTTKYIASATDLAAVLSAAPAISTLVWATGTVTVTFASAHNITIGKTAPIIVSGATPTGYNGSYLATATTATAVTYTLATDPGVATVKGVAYTGASAWLISADKTWWAQNGQTIGYYLFESGQATPTGAITATQTFIDANPQTIYNWCFLPGIDATQPQALSFFNLYNTYTSLLKFFLPVDSATYSYWSGKNTLQNVIATIQSPTYGLGTELDSIAYAAFVTNVNPTPSNKMPPSAYGYLYGVTAYPVNNSLMTTYSSGNINFVSTGAEGGISNTINVLGNMLNGVPFNVQYSIDWQQIQLNLYLANAVINGANSQINPLYYNQAGIDRLQAVAGDAATRGIATGLALGQVVLVQLDPTTFAQNLSAGLYDGLYVINAVPFATYAKLNPSDYAKGLYGGFQASFVPQYGFQRIVFNLQATQFA